MSNFQECIEWAKEEKRTFLRQSLESRLVGLYFETERYQEALALGSALLKELKKLDDKNLLVEVQLLESKTYNALGNLPKARAALTSARTTANSIYVPPKVQAQLDLQVMTFVWYFLAWKIGWENLSLKLQLPWEICDLMSLICIPKNFYKKRPRQLY